MSPEDSGPRNLFATRELRVVIAATVATIALASLALAAVYERTDFLYDDLGRWRITVPGRPVPPAYFRQLQPGPLQQPFRLVLALDRPPRAGDTVIAERTYRVDPSETYCFEVFVISDYFNPDSSYALDAFRTGVTVNDRRIAWFPLADRRRGDHVEAVGIEPISGRIDVHFEVRALAARERRSWQRASKVAFEFARLYRCKNPS